MKDLAIIETILRNRHHYFNEIREGVGLPGKMRAMLVSSIAFLALYGAVMGSTHSLWQALSSAAKLPILFLATLIVCSPTLYFFNVLFGSKQSLGQNMALILTAITVTAVLLLSFAPIILFIPADHQPLSVLQAAQRGRLHHRRQHGGALPRPGDAGGCGLRQGRSPCPPLGAPSLDPGLRFCGQSDGLDAAALHRCPQHEVRAVPSAWRQLLRQRPGQPR